MKDAKHVAEMAVEYGFAYKDMKADKQIYSKYQYNKEIMNVMEII
jgi:hypothetical protein